MNAAWHTVAAPVQALVSGFQCEQSQLSNHTWLYPFKQPTPAGAYEVCNAIIDRSQRIGSWSQPTTLTLKSGWWLYGHCWNQPLTHDEAGIAWKVKVLSATQFEGTPYTPGSEHYFYHGWNGQYQANTIAPYSYTLPRIKRLMQDSNRLFTLSMFASGGRNTTVAPAPVCFGGNLPNVAMEVAWCRVTETGETTLSPSFNYTPPSPYDGWVVAETCELPFGLQEQHPQGTIGYHVYVRLTGGDWQRVPAPHCYGEPVTVDDWLWQWHDRQPTIRRLAATNIGHSAAPNPQSRLNSLQCSLKNTTNNIVIDPNAIIDTYCPVIDEWRSSPEETFGRRIAATDGGKWKLQQQSSQSGHKYWPVLAVENSYSQWVGVEVQAKGGSAAVAFGDFSGGQAFGTRFIDCNFYTQSSSTGIVCGFLIDAKSTGHYGSHVASEIKCYNTKLNGDVPVWIGGNQAANIRFSETNMTSTGTGRQCSAVYLESPSQVVFVNGLNLDASRGGALFRASEYNAKLTVEGIWVDQGFYALVEACGVAFDAKLSAGKLNIRGDVTPTLAKYIDQHTLSKLIMADIEIQPDPNVAEVNIINGNYNMVETRFTDTALSDFATLREPTKAQTVAANVTWVDVVDVPVPGMKLTVQWQLSIANQSVALPEQSVTFNSLTGRQSIRRANWADQI